MIAFENGKARLQSVAMAASLFVIGLTGGCSMAGSDLDPSRSPADYTSELIEIFSDYSDETMPGVSVLVVKNGKVAGRFMNGRGDVGSSIPISRESVFNTGSVSKQFTVFAMLQLRDQGLLSLDDDIRNYIPELPDHGMKITLEQLARHTSGLHSPNYASLMGGWMQADYRTHRQMIDLTRRQRQLDFDPGSQYEYSNAGTALLSEVITRVSGKPFRDYMQEEVYQPLGMTHTFNRGEEALIIPKEVHSYYWEYDILKKALNPSSVQGYTNVYSTADDLAIWAANFRDRKLGSETIFQDMLSPTTLADGTIVEHMMGLFSTPYKGFQHIQHTGSDRGYVSYLGWYPEVDLIIVILCNIEGIELMPSAYKVADLYLPVRTQTEQTDASRFADEENFVELPAESLTPLAGNYWSDELGFDRRIQFMDNELHYVRSEQSKSALRPVSNTRFRMMGVNDPVYVDFRDGRMYFENATSSSEFVRFTPQEYSHSDLAEYEGYYVSEEASVGYRLTVCNGVLTASNAIRDNLPFSSIRKDYFRSEQWFLSGLNFRRNKAGTIAGFLASNVGISNVLFAKASFGDEDLSRHDPCATR